MHCKTLAAVLEKPSAPAENIRDFTDLGFGCIFCSNFPPRQTFGQPLVAPLRIENLRKSSSMRLVQTHHLFRNCFFLLQSDLIQKNLIPVTGRSKLKFFYCRSFGFEQTPLSRSVWPPLLLEMDKILDFDLRRWNIKPSDSKPTEKSKCVEFRLAR